MCWSASKCAVALSRSYRDVSMETKDTDARRSLISESIRFARTLFRARHALALFQRCRAYPRATLHRLAASAGQRSRAPGSAQHQHGSSQ
jgi:hypothetical protein